MQLSIFRACRPLPAALRTWNSVLPVHFQQAAGTATAAGLGPPHVPIKALATGAAAGCAGSLVGMGGGFISIPTMTSRFIGFSQHTAHATSLVAVLSCGTFGALSFAADGAVDFTAAAALGTGGMLTASLGVRLGRMLPGYALKAALGVLMMLIAPGPLLKPWLLEQGQQRKSLEARSAEEEPEAPDTSTSRSREFSRALACKLGVVGCSLGLIAGIFGVGGGAISVPALCYFTPELTHHQALGTALAAMVLPAFLGVVRHVQHGAIVASAAIPLSIGTSLGATFGTRCVTLKLDEQTLRCIFCGLMLVLGAQAVRSGMLLRRAALEAAAKAKAAV